MEARHAVALVSGGLDSTVVLWWALSRYDSVAGVLVTWGQATEMEQRAARVVADLAGIAVHRPVLSAPGSDLTPGDFTRGHSLLLVGTAGIYIGSGSGDILLGSLRSDRHADASAKFMVEATAALTGPPHSGAVRVLAPLLDLPNKAAVIASGLRMGAPVSRTRSCNRSVATQPCGLCVSCRERRNAWDAAVTIIEREDGITAEQVGSWQRQLASWHDPLAVPPTKELRSEIGSILALRSRLPWRKGWRYPAPDGATRFTGRMNPPRQHRQRYGWRPVSFVRVDENVPPERQPRWAMTILEDGTLVEQFGDPGAAITALAAMVAKSR